MHDMYGNGAAEHAALGDTLAAELADVLGYRTPPRVRFLARGEYSLNHVFERDGRTLVARLVTGSQIGLGLPEQVQYEAHALDLLAPSERTPRLQLSVPEPRAAPYPYLVIDFLPGRPVDYRTDLEAAARCVAAIHRLGVPANHRLQVHADAARSLLDEAAELAAPYLAWKQSPAASTVALRRLFEVAEMSADAVSTDAFDLAIVNTDLNSHNFVVHAGRARLLDWERARIAPAAQDLAHFLLPTTTLWRADSATRLTAADEALFIATYVAERPELDAVCFRNQLAALKAAVALRAVAWCAWALHATATGNRALGNAETLERGKSYLEPEFLDELVYVTVRVR